MARTVPGHPAGVVRTFVPSSLGNAEDPEPVEIDIKQPTEAERRELAAVDQAGTMLVDDAGNVVRDPTGNVKVLLGAGLDVRRVRRVLEKHVVGVRRYTSNTGKPITSGVELFEHGEAEFVRETTREIMRGMTISEAQKKTSAALSASSQAAILASNGTAESAAPPS